MRLLKILNYQITSNNILLILEYKHLRYLKDINIKILTYYSISLLIIIYIFVKNNIISLPLDQV